jgi:FlaA1/EpsC-like NDP-sugar epimerase
VLGTINRANNTLLRDVHAHASEAGVPVLVLPPVSESLERPTDTADVRPLDETDLLGPQTVDTD